MNPKAISTDVLVIGGGLAGCYDCEQECPVNAIYVSLRRGRPVPHAW